MRSLVEPALPKCLACGNFLRLEFVIYRNGEPHDSPRHQLVYSYAVVAGCRWCGGGQVEKCDHDCFSWDDTWTRHGWFLLEPEDYRELTAAMRLCPKPTWVPTCDCAVHEVLREAVRSLPVAARPSLVLPAWAPMEDLAPYAHRVQLSRRPDGSPMLRLETLEEG
jgi:hypothetical protein